MRARLFISLLACPLAACGSSDAKRDAPPVDAQSAGQQALHKLDEVNRAIALKRAIHDSGFQCQRIDRSGYVQEHKKLSVWAAACNDGRGWALFVGRDDSVQVRSCKEMQSLELPRCPAWAEQARRTR